MDVIRIRAEYGNHSISECAYAVENPEELAALFEALKRDAVDRTYGRPATEAK